MRSEHTLLLVDSEHDDYFVSADADELLDGSDTTSREFAKKNHAVDVVVFQ
jgi:hypothetical protein